MQLWEFPLSLSCGVSVFSCRRPGWPFPISFPHQCCGAERELTQIGFTKQLFTSLLGTLKFARHCKWPVLFMAKNIHKQSLCWHKLPVYSIWGIASTWSLKGGTPFLMHCVILVGVSSHLYFPSVPNLDVILQCSPGPRAGDIETSEQKTFSKHLRLSAEERKVFTEQEVFQPRNSSLKCWWKSHV